MKILMTTDNIGGVWRYSLCLAKGLKKFDVEIILAIIGEPLKKHQIVELEGITFYFKESKQEWMENPWNDVDKSGEWLMDIASSEKVDLVHLNSYAFGSLNWNIPVIITIHSCVLSWWEAVKKEKAPDGWNRYKNSVTVGLRSADLILSPSKWMLNAASLIYGFKVNSKVIYNGLDSLSFFPDVKENYVFCMGRLWDDAKNIKTVIEAASLIDYPVYIAGENSFFEKINTTPNVFFTGYLSPVEIADWLSNAAIFLLPVKYEPFGYSFLEAAFSECALITGDIPSMKEIWSDSAIYVDPDNEIQISFEIKKIMNDTVLREHLGKKARERAIEYYTSDKMFNEYLSVYRNTLKTVKKELKPLIL